MTSIYLAGPVAALDDGGKEWRRNVVRDHADIDWLNPVEEINAPDDGIDIVADGAETVDDGVVTAEEIVESDLRLLRQADAVLVGYEDVRMIGTPMEVMWSCERDIPIALWIRDETPFGELSPWFRHFCGCLTNARDLAVDHLAREVDR